MNRMNKRKNIYSIILLLITLITITCCPVLATSNENTDKESFSLLESTLAKVTDVVLELGGNTAKLDWKEVPNADGYELLVNIPELGEVNLNANSNTITLVGIPASDQLYSLKLRAFKNSDNSKIYGDYSDQVEFKIEGKLEKENIEELATEIQDLKSELHGDSVNLTWEKINNVDGYDILLDIPGKGEYSIESETNSKLITGLSVANGTYTAKIRSFINRDNEKNYGEYSDSISFDYLETAERIKQTEVVNNLQLIENRKDIASLKANTETLNKLIEDASKTGGTVVIPKGTYYFAALNTSYDELGDLGSRYVINCKSNVTIKGAGQSETILKPVAVDNLLNNTYADKLPIDMFHYNGIYVKPNAQTLQNANFMDFTIDSSEATSSGEYNALGKGFSIEYCENCNFDHILIKNTEGTGFGINFPVNSTISNCIALGCGRKATIQNEGASGFGIGIGYSNNESLTITNCESIGNRKYGFCFEDQNLWRPDLCKAIRSNGFKIINSKAKNNLYDFGGRRAYNLTLTGCIANGDVSINSNPLNSKNEKAFAFMPDSRNIKFENNYANMKYSDVTDRSYYTYEPTYWALNNGIIDGGLTNVTGQNVTEANVTASVNRAQAVLMLHRFAGRPGDIIQGDSSFVTNPSFKDVPGENNAYTYCADAVLWAENNNIISKNETLFRPADGCTRSEFLIMLYKYKNNVTIYSNDDATYQAALAWGSKNGIINTKQDFNPDKIITKGDLLTMLYRCLYPLDVDPEPSNPSPTPSTQPSQSNQVTGLKAVVNGSNVDISWDPIMQATVIGQNKLYYDVYLDEPGMFYIPERKPNKTTNSNKVTLPLNSNGQYTVTVRPYYYSNGQKVMGNGASINFNYNKQITPPSQVTGLKANIKGSNVQITWDPIMQATVIGQNKLYYDVYLEAPGMVYLPERNPDRTTNSNNVTLSLNNYGNYTVTVIPYYISSNSQKITGNASSINFTYSKQATQVPGLPNIPQNLGLQDVTVKLSYQSGNIQTITWNSVYSATAYYYVILKDNVIVSQGQTAKTILNYAMKESGTYTVYVRAFTSYLSSNWSNPINFTYTAPTAIKPGKVSVTIEPQRSNYIPIRWNPVEGATGYELYVSDNNKSNTSIVTGTGVNLTINTTSIYKIKVRAINDTYKGDWSNTYELKSINYRQKPGKVTVTIGAQKSNYIPIRWNPVEGATEYELNVITDKNKNTTMKVSGTGTNFIIDTNTVYTIKVRGINDTYKGEWSNSHTFKSINYRPKPSKVTNLRVTAFPSSKNGYNVTLQWDKIPNATSYDVLVYVPGYCETTMRNVKLSYQGNSVSTTVGGCNFGTFAFKVRAVNASGEGEYSYQVSAPIVNY